ncbi:uncharacterized protein N7469_010481 [Penicillium citrinum]|uniref:Peptidase S59 domain-containing protein n=1 Tax=Penicillium citrinum TaxID=5077 RepID=A0A9W9NKC4_PENCI|nr:uncharacterized protein N7469_010481 [Penicillium citrinum]KAJ5221594.1 hypothetical protein N7469_010481 [Penicillium citrinum]
MSFGFGGAGFGQSNNQSSGFGTGSGFGTSNTGGFGSGSATPSAFGGNTSNTNSGGGLFGNTSSSFGTGGGFGANTQNNSGSLFGGQNRTSGFGSTNNNTGGSLFGSTTNTGNAGGFGSSTGGGFGSGTTGGFGSSATNTNTGGGLFGANKPAGGFGSTGTTGGFGSSNTGGAFGSSTNTGFGGGGTALAGGALPPCDGTGSTPFNAFTEKDTNSSVMNHYQSISFMQPYNKYSFEELRLADYERGRRFGNGSNQAGAFGSSSFGGTTTGTGFGSQQNTTGFGASTTPFGAANTSAPSTFGSTQTTGGFGSTNNANPLFGANKPATSMFGGGTATTQSGSLFGGGTATAGTGGGFGSSTGTGSAFGANSNTGGGLFGGNTQQNKPAFGATGTGTGFGSGGGFGTQQSTTNTNPFGGSTTGSTGFGQPAQTGTSAFGGGLGANQNQTQNKSLFGGGGGSAFGTNTQQQGTGSSLFGGSTTQQPATGGGLFGGGNTQTQQTGTGSLFGGNQSQPATGGGLFGGQNQTQQKPGGLFGGGTGSTGGAFGGLGNTQPQQPASGGLFGGQPQTQQKPGGLFGNSTGTTGGGLFGQSNNTQQNTGSSLFGNQGQQQQPANNSLFGGSQPAPQQSQPVPGSLTSSLLGGNPYGSQSIFSGLPTPDAPSPGPLATPLSSSLKQKQRAPLPYSITPGGANRLSTPPKRQGYGFSYSTYGSPSSSTSTPSGFSNSLLGGAGSGSLRGSIGGNLRKTFDPESDSVLSPGALQSSAGRSNGGSMKRLTIDRSLRTDLFARPASTSPAPAVTNGDDSVHSDKLKKKVSFDATSSAASGSEIVRVEEPKSPEPTPQELGFLRSQRRSGSLNGIDGPGSEPPEMESISHDLAVVPENGEPVPAGSSSVTRLSFVPGSDPKPGEYWMKPSRNELNKMTRDQLKQVVDFTVGRQHCGSVTFGGPVDLTTVDLENIFGKIVDIGVRKITVYPEEAVKPPMGKGLNVVSTLRIENSWPRGRDKKSPLPITSGPLFDKHIERLQRVTDTEFLNYDKQTGTWTFKVPHFTTYGLDYDEDDEGETLDQSTLGAGPDDNRTPKAASDHPASFEQSATFSIDESFVGSMVGVDDDTFDFKKRKLVPGSFGSQAMEMQDEEMHSEGETESFLEEGSTGLATEHDDDVTQSQHSGDFVVGYDEDQTMDMAGSFPKLHHTVEREDSQSTDGDLDTTHPLKQFGTPPKPRLDLSGDWAEQLQRTISPRKQNRDALREIQANAFADRDALNEASSEQKSSGSPKKGFANSIDLMNSLFQQPRKQGAPSPAKASKAQPKGFEWPYNKQPKTFAGDATQMNHKDAAFHDSFKPRWGPMDSLVCAKNDFTEPISDVNTRWQESFSVFSEGRDIAILKYHETGDSQDMLNVQKQQSTIDRVDGTPFVRLPKIDLRQFAFAPSQDEERLVWQLANILFNDDIEDDISAGVPPALRSQFAHRIKKDRLTRLWESIIREKHAQALDSMDSAEERAIFLLSCHRVEEACKVLVESQNLHLSTLVAQIGRDATSQAELANQIEVWRQNNVLSEMTEPLRALYELVAGNCLRSEGKTGGALEDRASTFVFTERFELDWIQAFGLRLWYATTEDEPIETAVSKFLDDLGSGVESAFPHPSHEASSRASLQPGSDTLGRESPLWVLLKTYAAIRGDKKVPRVFFPAAILPESLSGDRLSNRLAFQLHHVLAAAVGKTDAIQIDQHQADRLVWDYASELIASEQLQLALFAMLHLSKAEDRKRAVQDTLARFGASLPDPTIANGNTPDPAWQYLVTELQLPESWLWVAKALQARASGDAIREVDALIRGKHWNDAHGTFCRVVGPTAVISRDYATLEQLITGFGEGPERKMRGWSSGGGIYEDFLRLATATRGRRDPTRLTRLVNALVSMGDRIRNGSGIDGLEERVAFKEMSRTVAGWITQEDVKSVEASKILGLPLTGDSRVLQTVEMSRRYYGIVMASGF